MECTSVNRGAIFGLNVHDINTEHSSKARPLRAASCGLLGVT